MKDISIFPTEYGVASLILREIPYRQEAYIRVQDVQPGMMEQLVKECVDFCRACGAERIYWSAGNGDGQLHTAIFEMRGASVVNPELVEHLFPVTEETVLQWRQLLNEKMIGVDNAATVTYSDQKALLESGGAYFVHRDGHLLGLGWMEDNKLLAVAALEPGAGERVMHTLMSLVEGQTITLEVASTNRRAIRLYEKLGFVKTREIRRWYCT
jgi:GNAT superfamily N-acetyltransferase